MVGLHYMLRERGGCRWQLPSACARVAGNHWLHGCNIFAPRNVICGHTWLPAAAFQFVLSRLVPGSRQWRARCKRLCM